MKKIWAVGFVVAVIGLGFLALLSHVRAAPVAPILFADRLDYPVGGTPESIALADVDKDGRLDLLSADNGDDTFSVLLGTATGLFGDKTSFGVGLGPIAIATGDIDADGNLDALVLNESSADLSAFLGDGAGGFSAASAVSAGTGPRGLAVAKINADAYDDVLVAGYGSDNVIVMLSNGVGGFNTSTIALAASSCPAGIAVGKFNTAVDSFLDAAVVRECDDTLTLLYGDGTGAFPASDSTGLGASPYAVKLADLDGDGNLDAVAANANDDTLSVVLGDGSSTLGTDTTFATVTTPHGLDVADVNGDAKLDVVVASADPDANECAVMQGDGAGSLNLTARYDAGVNPDDVLVRDVTGDSQLDIICSNFDAGTVSVIEGSNTGFITPPSFAGGSFPDVSVMGDLNQDGLLDVALANTGGKVAVVLATGASTFAAPVSYTTTASIKDIGLGDIDKDGDLDLVTVHTAGIITEITGDGTGTFTVGSTYSANTSPRQILLVDVNNDTDLDAVVLNPATISVLLGGAGSSFGAAITYPVSGTGNNIAAGDIDEDGLPDLVVSRQPGSDVSVYLNTLATPGTFGAAANHTIGLFPFYVSLQDYNGDGHLDIFAKVTTGVASLAGDGTGSFSSGSSIPASSVASDIDWGDFDNDGDNDMVLTNDSLNTVAIAFDQGSTFSDLTHYGVGSIPVTAVVGDVNADRRPDILSMNFIDNTLTLLENKLTNNATGVTIIESDGSTQVVEGVKSDTYTVELKTQPRHNVTIAIAPDAQLITDVSLLTFTSADWSIPQTVTVNAIEDNVEEGKHSGVITHSSDSLDPDYFNASIANVDVTILDETRRCADSDPVALAICVSQEQFLDGEAEAVVLARSDLAVDGFVGGPFTSRVEGSLLLTAPDGLDARVATELTRVLANGTSSDIFLLGLTQALSQQVETDLATAGYSSVQRIGGEHRRETARLIAEEIVVRNPSTPRIFVTEDQALVDAMSISAVAGEHAIDNIVDPILLTGRRRPDLDPNVLAFVQGASGSALTDIVAVGGLTALPENIVISLSAASPNANVTRVSGEDRYVTSANIALTFYPDARSLYIASGQRSTIIGARTSVSRTDPGQNYEALLSGLLGAAEAAPVQLVERDSVPDAVKQYIVSRAGNLDRLVIVGSLVQVSAEIEQYLQSLL